MTRAAQGYGLSDRPFRFAVQATPQDGPQWLATAKRAEDLGYATLMMADGMQLLSPLPALAMAAGATSTLRVSTFVLASVLRPPGLAAWDAHSLSVLSDGRFEFGIGTGRPEAVEQAVQQAGQPPTTGAERLARVEQTIDTLRELDGDWRGPARSSSSHRSSWSATRRRPGCGRPPAPVLA